MSANSNAAKRSRPTVNETLEARVQLLQPATVNVPLAGHEKFSEISTIISVAGRQLKDVVTRDGESEYDVGRLIAALDLLKQCKSIASDAVLIPYAVDEIRDEQE